MKITPYQAIPENTETCCTKTTIKELTPHEIGIPNLNIKLFEIHPNGYSPLHQHPELHRLFITSGKGTLSDGQKTVPIQSGDIVYIEANEPHQLKTVGTEPLKFICLTMDTQE
jgi:quercetin dioxygenase-like cupin family protein